MLHDSRVIAVIGDLNFFFFFSVICKLDKLLLHREEQQENIQIKANQNKAKKHQQP